MPHKFMY